MIRAIETRYAGCRFRSRLEARWAVFFDALGIKWQYEPEGFCVPRLGEDEVETDLYLPDFFLTDLGTWVEVKGSLEGIDDAYFQMIASAVDWGGALPGISDSCGSTRGLLWLGPIPSDSTCAYGSPYHAILQHNKGGWINGARFGTDGTLEIPDKYCHGFDSSWGDQSEMRKHLQERTYGAWAFPERRCPTVVRVAYAAARSARFEHGECG